MTSDRRVVIGVDEETEKELRELGKAMRVNTRKAIVLQGLSLLRLMLREREAGRRVVVMDGEGHVMADLTRRVFT